MSSCCQTRTMERKSQLKTIKVRLFSLSLISLSCSCFRIGAGSGDEELVNHAQCWEDIRVASVTPLFLWGLAGDGVTACYTLPPLTTSICLGPVMLPEVKTGSDRWSHCERKSTESWAHNSGLLRADMMERFCHNGGLKQTSTPPIPPLPMKYWSFFLRIIFSCTRTCFIPRLFCSHFIL